MAEDDGRDPTWCCEHSEGAFGYAETKFCGRYWHLCPSCARLMRAIEARMDYYFAAEFGRVQRLPRGPDRVVRRS